jgi:hypothetical protein
MAFVDFAALCAKIVDFAALCAKIEGGKTPFPNSICLDSAWSGTPRKHVVKITSFFGLINFRPDFDRKKSTKKNNFAQRGLGRLENMS